MKIIIAFLIGEFVGIALMAMLAASGKENRSDD